VTTADRAGEVPASIRVALQEWSDKIDSSLAAGNCPECASPGMRGALDERQSGAKPSGTEWWHYHCGACDYVIDVTRPEAKA
jgi:hypothetical protein